MRRYRLSSETESDDTSGWTPIKVGSESDPGTEAAQRALAEVLECDHVVVLCGLGTSLCIRDPADPTKLLFPTMGVLWSKVSDKVGGGEFLAIAAAVGADCGSNNIEDLLSRCKMALALQPAGASKDPGPDVAAFVNNAEQVIRTECRKTLAPSATEVHGAVSSGGLRLRHRHKLVLFQGT
jgi:hypothetical protein